MNTCKTCAHWTPGEQDGGGLCKSKKITEDRFMVKYPSDMLIYSYNEGGTFWVGPDFGCVHHEPSEEKR